jgi:IS5 family transposase
MTQLGLGLNLSTKRTRKREFLDEMTRVVPWQKFISLIEPHYSKGKMRRPPFHIARMLRIHSRPGTVPTHLGRSGGFHACRLT